MEGNPLAALRDVQLPPAPDGFSLLPVLIGAGALFCLLVLLGLIAVRLRNRWSREVANALGEPCDDPLTEAARLLRQAGILCLGQGVARQQGDAWLASLDRIFRTRFFTAGEGRIFAGGLYAPQTDAGDVIPKLRRVVLRRAWLP